MDFLFFFYLDKERERERYCVYVQYKSTCHPLSTSNTSSSYTLGTPFSMNAFIPHQYCTLYTGLFAKQEENRIVRDLVMHHGLIYIYYIIMIWSRHTCHAMFRLGQRGSIN
jgi:hypothetical protein